MMAQRLGLDPVELIRAANLDYPRPDLARPGFVAGPCMSKDPYLLRSAFDDNGFRPQLIQAARALNEAMPRTVAEHILRNLKELGVDFDGTKVLICGFAYKGWPVTDDIRGTPAVALLEALRAYPLEIWCHDPLVAPAKMAALGARPVADIEEGFRGARAAVFVNEHPAYRALEIERLGTMMERPGLIYDCWRMFDQARIQSVAELHYAGIGYG
jgi:UDP-N-acetyl-D-mannosaminuronic acid dehydrogenase